jgi:hypothetical protein
MIFDIAKTPKEVRITTMRDGGSLYLDALYGDNWVNICWICNVIGADYRSKLLKPYEGKRVFYPVQRNELMEFNINVTQILKHMVITNEQYDTTKKAAFERELRKLSETYETYYTASTGP